MQIPGRTDNEIKNYWNTHLKKRLILLAENHQESQFSSILDHPNAFEIRSSTTRHMVQWERARLEAEVRLPMESSLLITSSPDPIVDHFLLLWNSEVGRSFREVNVKSGTLGQNPASQTCSMEELGYVKRSASSDMIRELEDGFSKPQGEVDVIAVSSGVSSHEELSDSANSVSELLLDFSSGYDSDFFEGKDVDFPISLH